MTDPAQHRRPVGLRLGYLQATVENLLPDMVAELEPYWADFNASGASGFVGSLVQKYAA